MPDGAWLPETLPPGATRVGDRAAYQWVGCDRPGDPGHVHSIGCLWVWHYCTQVLGPESVEPGALFGWRPAGVNAHTLAHAAPLTIEPSLYWPDCCGLHGWIRDGAWIQA
jgi:hypothetical protein